MLGPSESISANNCKRTPLGRTLFRKSKEGAEGFFELIEVFKEEKLNCSLSCGNRIVLSEDAVFVKERLSFFLRCGSQTVLSRATVFVK